MSWAPPLMTLDSRNNNDESEEDVESDREEEEMGRLQDNSVFGKIDLFLDNVNLNQKGSVRSRSEGWTFSDCESESPRHREKILEQGLARNKAFLVRSTSWEKIFFFASILCWARHRIALPIHDLLIYSSKAISFALSITFVWMLEAERKMPKILELKIVLYFWAKGSTKQNPFASGTIRKLRKKKKKSPVEFSSRISVVQNTKYYLEPELHIKNILWYFLAEGSSKSPFIRTSQIEE